MTVTVAIGDVHIPYEDRTAIECAFSIIRSIQPDNVVLIGDIIDFYTVSKYAKDPTRINTLQEEIDQTYQFLSEVRDVAPKARIIYMEGNHEDRLNRFLMTKAPELYCLRFMQVARLLRLNDFKMEYNDGHEVIGDTTFTHGHIVRKHSAYSARAMAEEYGTVLFGHTHRLGMHHKRDGRGDMIAIENGCLCELDPGYVKGIADWQQGFTVITYIDDHSAYEQVRIYNGQAIFRGKKWK